MNINSSTHYSHLYKTYSSNEPKTDISQMRPIAITEDMVSRQSAETIQENKEALAKFEATLQALDNGSLIPDNAPENLYAEIKRDGEAVAKTWEKGSIYLPNKYAAALSKIPENSSAEERTQLLLNAIGGTLYYKNSRQDASNHIAQSLYKNNCFLY